MKLLFFSIIILTSSNICASVKYVNSIATGSNNGSSWTHAYTTLYTAVAGANSGDTLYVAEGNYFPNGTGTNSQALVITKNLIILGGFPNSGSPTLAARNFKTKKTIFTGKFSITNIAHELLLLYDNDSTIFDGFIFEDGTNDIQYSGVIYSESHNIFRNCIFQKLKSIRDNNQCIYAKNTKFINCYFLNNYGNNTVITLYDSTSIINSVFYRNNTYRLINLKKNSANTKCYLINNTFYKNDVTVNPIILQDTQVTAYIENNIFYNNGDYYIGSNLIYTGGPEIGIKDTAKAFIGYNITQNMDYKSSNLYKRQPFFLDEQKIFGNDTIPFTQDDGLQLISPCTQGVDIGNNASVFTNTDILSNSRIINSTVDIGAFELLSPSSFNTIYVNSSATGANNGTSWNNAFTNLKDAFKICTDTIKIAAGVYKIQFDTITPRIYLRNNLKILGGYPNTGNPTNAQRNPSSYKSIISGLIDSANDIRDGKLFEGINLDSTFYMDGIRFEKFRSHAAFISNKLPTSVNEGILTFHNCKSIILKNLYFENNSSYLYFNNCSNMKLINTNFFHNGRFHLDKGHLGETSIYSKNSSISFQSLIARNAITYRNDSMNYSKVLLLDSSICTIENSIFEDINGRVDGIYDDNMACIGAYNNTQVRIKKSYFSNIDASIGSVISSNNSLVELDTVELYRCRNTAVYASNSTILCHKVYMEENTAYRPQLTAADFNVSNSTLDFNNSMIRNSNYGHFPFAGPYAITAGGCTINFKNSLFIADKSMFNESTSSFLTPKFAQLSSTQFNLLNSTIYTREWGGKNSEILNSNYDFHVKNSIVWGYSIDKPASATNVIVQNSLIIDTFYGNGNIVKENPRFKNIDNIRGADNILFTEDDGFSIEQCSPAINAGNNNLLGANSLDITSNQRIVNTTVDMGAYENTSGVYKATNTCYVNSALPINGNGNTWGTAYNRLSNAILNQCADTIKVMKGLYDAKGFTMNYYLIDRPLTIIGSYNLPNDTIRYVDKTPSIIDTGYSGTLNYWKNNGRFYINNIIGRIRFEGLQIKNAKITISEKGDLELKNDRLNKCEVYNYNKLNTIHSVISDTSYIFNYTPHLNIDKSILINNLSNCIWSESTMTMKNSALLRTNGNFGAITLFNTNDSSIFINNTFAWNRDTNGGTLCYGRAIESFTESNGTTAIKTTFKNNLIESDITNNFCTRGNNSTYLCDFDIQLDKTCAANIVYPWSSILPNVSANKKCRDTVFYNPTNPIGNDGLWFTIDDGYNLKNCKNAYPGVNSVAPVPIDIKGSNRILGTSVELGAYEFEGCKLDIQWADTTVCSSDTIKFKVMTYGCYDIASYQWQLNGVNVGTNSSQYISTSHNAGDSIRVRMIINDTCIPVDTIYSNYLKLNVTNASTAKATISISESPTCKGQNFFITSNFTNMGSSPSFQWRKNGTVMSSNDTLHNQNILHGDTIQLYAYSNLSCLNGTPIISNKIIINILDTTPPSISIAQVSSILCSGEPSIFKATISNRSTNDKISWFKNGVIISNASDTILSIKVSTNDSIYCKAIRNLSCIKDSIAISNILKLNNVITTDTARISISTLTNPFCLGSVVNFKSSFANGGTSSAFQWKKNGVDISGAVDSIYSSALFTTNDTISCILTSNKVCVLDSIVRSNKVILQGNSVLTPSIIIKASRDTICLGDTILFSSIITNGGINPTYQWYKNGLTISGANSPSYTTTSLSNGDLLTCKLTSNATCALPLSVTSNLLQTTVVASIFPTIRITTPQTTICAGATVGFSSIITNGGTNPSFQWRKNGIPISSANSYISSSINHHDTLYAYLTSSHSCANPKTVVSNKLIMNIQTITPISIKISSNNNVLNAPNKFSVTSMVTGNPKLSYQWQDSTGLNSWQNITGANKPFITYSAQPYDKLRCILTSSDTCLNPMTASSNVITFHKSSTIINNDQTDYIYVHPNPVHSILTISNLLIEDKWSYGVLTDAMGRNVIDNINLTNRQEVDVDLSNIPQGIYILFLTSRTNNIKYIKITKE